MHMDQTTKMFYKVSKKHLFMDFLLFTLFIIERKYSANNKTDNVYGGHISLKKIMFENKISLCPYVCGYCNISI